MPPTHPQPHIQNAIFWIEVDKIEPNPYQPRREFDEDRLKELSESIRQYGVLQPLVVSRVEEEKEDGSIAVKYQLIAGERRLRASKLANLLQVPVVVRVGDDSRQKLELAIIENVQREDLNPVERAQSFQRLADEFKISWSDIGKKVGKSREYVSNTVRILMLPQDILDAVSKGHITEGHTRPLLMLIDRPHEQMTLFKEMLVRKMTVREAEQISRRIAYDKVRRTSTLITPEVIDMEEKLAETLGTRVHIEPREKGGKIMIDYFTHEELLALSHLLRIAGEKKSHKGMFDTIREEDMETIKGYATVHTDGFMSNVKKYIKDPKVETSGSLPESKEEVTKEVLEEKELAVDDRSLQEVKQEEQEEDLYNLSKFTV
jgi:ParB family chromosome partitioning protein